MLNFILMIYRCAMGVDFEIEYDVDEGDLLTVTDLESAGLSNRNRSEKESRETYVPGANLSARTDLRSLNQHLK